VAIAVVGIEPEIIDYGLDLSPTVAANIPRLLETVRRAVECWNAQPALRAKELCALLAVKQLASPALKD
jgi:hypothetical protein